MRGIATRVWPPTAWLVQKYLLYWYKSTNTDAEGAGSLRPRGGDGESERFRRLRVQRWRLRTRVERRGFVARKVRVSILLVRPRHRRRRVCLCLSLHATQVCSRILTYPHVCSRMLTDADGCWHVYVSRCTLHSLHFEAFYCGSNSGHADMTVPSLLALLVLTYKY